MIMKEKPGQMLEHPRGQTNSLEAQYLKEFGPMKIPCPQPLINHQASRKPALLMEANPAKLATLTVVRRCLVSTATASVIARLNGMGPEEWR